MTNVLIAAPTPMMRAGLRAMLAGDEIQVVGDTAALVELPPGGNGFDVLVLGDDELLTGRPRDVLGEGALAVVVLSDEQWPARTLNELPLRGWAVLPVESSAAELRAAVIAVAQGLIALPLPLARQLLAPRSPVQVSATDTIEQLTPRELEVLQALSDGLSNKLIARKLLISEHTVKFHVSAIYTKLGAVSRADAVSRGARAGLLTL